MNDKSKRLPTLEQLAEADPQIVPRLMCARLGRFTQTYATVSDVNIDADADPPVFEGTLAGVRFAVSVEVCS